MSMWFAYKIDPGAKFRLLGNVEASDYDAALTAAWAEWPDERDPNQTQNGFSIRERPIKERKS